MRYTRTHQAAARLLRRLERAVRWTLLAVAPVGAWVALVAGVRR